MLPSCCLNACNLHCRLGLMLLYAWKDCQVAPFHKQVLLENKPLWTQEIMVGKTHIRARFIL